jgi:hypothetical protein
MRRDSFRILEETVTFSFTNKNEKTDFVRIEFYNNNFTMYRDEKVLFRCSADSREQGIEKCKEFLLSNF